MRARVIVAHGPRNPIPGRKVAGVSLTDTTHSLGSSRGFHIPTMDAAVSLHHHGALPAAALPHHHHHRAALHLRHPPPPSSVSARLTVTAAPRRSSSSSLSASAAPAVPARATAITSSRAATGYAAALADASLRAGTLPAAARHARALLRRLREPPRGQRLEDPDARVGALVRLLVGKGKAGMVADVLAEFAALCDHLLAPPSTSTKRAHAY